MSKKHKVIIIPGLGDETKKIQFVTRYWNIFGLEPIVYSLHWRDKKVFKQKLLSLCRLIDTLSHDGNTVSLIGSSAGGSAVLNAFIERKHKIYKVVTVCARLKIGTDTGPRSFTKCTRTSSAFAESLKLLEQKENSLTINDRAKIMTVRAQFGDELVPADTSYIEGAHNITIPTIEHMFSIGMALTVFSKPIISFVQNKK